MKLSDDARALISAWFMNGSKCSVKAGGEGAENVLSDRCETAMRELIKGGYVIEEEYNRFGRMKYIGTDKCLGAGYSFDEIMKHEGFALTKPALRTARRGK